MRSISTVRSVRFEPLVVSSEKMLLLKRLVGIQAVAGEAATKLVDRGLLKRNKGQADPALYNLVA